MFLARFIGIPEVGGLRFLIIPDGSPVFHGTQHGFLIAESLGLLARKIGNFPVPCVDLEPHHDFFSGDDSHSIIKDKPDLVDRRDCLRRPFPIAPFVGHQNHKINDAAMSFVIVRLVKKAPLRRAGLRGQRSGNKIILRMQPYDGAFEKTVVGITVFGKNIFKIDI
ncbi:hypothetical protein SDC9_161171 [bioreactor metagenome]|uniref:Uncharacterized protein n=1 Tax=bioreactor metagenome TaxID=1076179 RepID=A0A645FHD8_9ZZZZ